MSAETQAEEPTATIYDLGYKRYVGPRRSQATRWQVVTRQQLSQAWKRWWRFKLWLGFSVLITVVVGAVMVLSRSEEMGELRHNGMVVSLVDQLVFGAIERYRAIGFLLTLTVGVGVVASDLRTGAFTFYFSRPVRPIDYVVGKLVALFTLQACVILIPMFLLAGVRVGLSADTDELISNLSYLPKTLLVGALASLVYASVSLGFSSLMAAPKLNLAIWACVYLLGLSMIFGVGIATKQANLAAVDFTFALQSMAMGLFEVDFGRTEIEPANLYVSIVIILAYTAAGIAVAYWRVNAAAHKGIGGAS